MRDPDQTANRLYFLLLPKGEGATGFLPAPVSPRSATPDFRLTFPAAIAGLERFDPKPSEKRFVTVGQSTDIFANWETSLLEATDGQKVTLADYLKNAYLLNHPLSAGRRHLRYRRPGDSRQPDAARG